MEVVSINACESFVTKDGSIIRELLSHRNSSIRNQSLAEATVPPGSITESHYHPLSEEIYFIQSGKGIMHLGDRAVPIGPGDAIAIPPGTIHWLHNDQDQPLKLLCCCSPAYEHNDTVIVDRSSQGTRASQVIQASPKTQGGN